MAKTSLSVKGSGKNPASIYLRFWESKSIDIEVRTGLYVVPKFWDKKAKKIRNVIDVPNRDEINTKLILLQASIVSEFNSAHSGGEVIDRQWLEGIISKFFNRPKGEVRNKLEAYKIYLSDYATWWLAEKAPKHKVTANKYMDELTIRQYKMAVDNLVKYEGKDKVKMREITNEWFDSFAHYLRVDENYSEKTAKRKIARIKFFCERAEADNIEVNKNYKERVFILPDNNDYMEPYLNEVEIKSIFKVDLSHNTNLDISRDNLIIGLWTGLRISDFLTKLDISNIKGDFIEIKTKKTKHKVSIPLHPLVRHVLKKYNGLPPKISEPKFNAYIKIVGQLAEIDNEMMGGVAKVDKDTGIKRKVVGLYKKYELITSHICRRSWCTNHYGKLPNHVIMAVQGWKKEDQMLDYMKQTSRESAMVVKDYWENNYEEKYWFS